MSTSAISAEILILGLLVIVDAVVGMGSPPRSAY
jgi:hypothetical protein